MNNAEIREAAMRSGVKLWEVAEGLGIADTTMSKWLRKEITGQKKTDILAMIQKIAAQKAKVVD